MTADFVRDVAIHLARRSVRMSRARGVLDGPPDSGLPADDALLTGLPLVGDKKSITACKFQVCKCAAASPQSPGPILSTIPVPNPLHSTSPYQERPSLFILVIQTRGNRLQPRSMARQHAWSVGMMCLAAAFGGARAAKGKDFSASKALMPSFAMVGPSAATREQPSPLPRPPTSLTLSPTVSPAHSRH